jgi:cytochrome c556
VATAAKAAQFDRATEAAAKMGARCNACHDLHPEKR